jgi:hypothetical protein
MEVLSKLHFKHQYRKNKKPGLNAPGFLSDIETNYIGFLVVSFLVVSVLVVSVLVVSVVGAGATDAAESVFVLSEPSVDFVELQPATIEPIIVATNAKLKKCFFIDINLIVLLTKNAFRFINPETSKLFNKLYFII